MKKILVLVTLITLITSMAYAVEWTSALSSELAAQDKGRSRTTDSSVILKVWCKDAALTYPGVGVSNSSHIIVWTNYMTGTGITIDTGAAATDTVGEIVDYINTNLASDSSIKLNASVGRDAYRGMLTSELTVANIVVCGIDKDNAATVAKQSNDKISAGVEARDGMIPRLKSILSTLPLAASTTGNDGLVIRIYDGNTVVWRNYITYNAYNSATGHAASTNSITFGEDGLTATQGNSLCVIADGDSNVNADAGSIAQMQISIVYDELKQ